MDELICPVCGRSNSNKLETCQYCGSSLQPSNRPGGRTDKKIASDRDSSLPGWLKKLSRESTEKDDSMPESENPASPENPAEPSASKKPAVGPFNDYLAGLSNLGEEDEETPDWLSNLQKKLPSQSQAEPVKPPEQRPESNWISGLTEPLDEQPFEPENEPGSARKPADFTFDDKFEPASQASEPSPDWLNAFNTPDKPSSSVQPFEQPAPQSEKKDQSDLTDLPDWLASLTGASDNTQPAQPVLPEENPASAGEPADWLSDLGSDFKIEESPLAGDAPVMATGEAPDWLDRMGADLPTAAEPAKVENPPATDQPDWMANLANTAPAAAEPSSAKDIPAASAALPVDDMSAWLSSLNEPTPAEAEAHESLETSAAQPADDMSAWLSSLNEPTPAEAEAHESLETSAALPAEDMPDWLSSLKAATPPPVDAQETPTSNAALSGDDMPDWLDSIKAPAPPPAEPQDVPAAGAALPADEMPDWLASMKAPTPPPAEQQGTPEAGAALPADEMPDWMASMNAPIPSPAEPQDIPEAGAALPADDMPDWLASLKPAEPELLGGQAAAESPAELPADDIPDWLANLQGSTPPGSSGAPESTEMPVQPPFEDETDSLAAANKTDENQPAPSQEIFDSHAPALIEAPDQGTDMPDWLAEISGSFKLETQSPEAVPPAPAAPETPRASAAEAPLPVQTGSQPEEDGLIPATPGDQNIDSILSMDTPDWLSSFTLPKEKPAAAPADKAPLAGDLPSDDLPTADLPSWVQALRPMESVLEGTTDDEEDQGMEDKGPLAGLLRILPGQTAPAVSHPSKTYSTKLLTSETQQAQAALLANILSSENSPRQLSKKSKSGNNRLLRWIIAAVLLLVIMALAAYGSRIFPAPVPPDASAPIGLFIQTVTDLPDGAAVLVVVDYQPGFAGEMEGAAGPVIEQLMSKNARLAFVSTSPMGGLMADRLIQKFASVYTYQAGQQYVNLGYLPGGAGGIRVFADQPAATLGQDALLGNLWDTPVLKDVTVNSETSLSNFAAVIVATDNPDTGRLWIEQAQPVLKSKPMLMVVSAQAEPMIRPYFNSNQVTGLVAGLEGGMQYEVARGKPGQATVYWDTFGAGILISEISILIGGVWSLISHLRTRRGAANQEEI